jgi:hypothetical protein
MAVTAIDDTIDLSVSILYHTLEQKDEKKLKYLLKYSTQKLKLPHNSCC